MPPIRSKSRRPCRPLLACVVLGTVLALPVATPAHAAPQRQAGRAVAEVLQDANGRGLHLIFSTDIVPPTLRVLHEPRAAAGIELVIEVLAPHGLTVQQAAPGTWTVVAAPPAPPPVTAAAAQEPQSRLLDPVVVTASRYVLATDVPGAHTFLTREQIEFLPKMADEALRTVQRLPGMASNGLSGLAHVRGGEENETAVLLDGFPLYEPFHLRNFFSPVSLLDARIVESLDVYTGGFGTRYGERMSGVVDARTRQASTDGQGEIGISLFHTNALGGGRFAGGRGKWLASFRRSHIGEVAELTHSEIGDPSYADAFGRLSFAFTPAVEASLSFLLSRDRIRVTEEAETADASYGNRYAWVTVERRGDAMHARLIASYTRVSSDREGSVEDPGRRLGSVDDERHYRALGLKLDTDLDLGRWSLGLGAEARSLRADYSYQGSATFAAGHTFPSDPPRSFVRDLESSPHGAQYAAWIAGRVNATERLTAELGLRWEAQEYTGLEHDDVLDPRLNLRYEVRDGFRLQGSLGRYHQGQGINELQVEDGVTEFHGAQRATHAVLGAEFDLPREVLLRVELYRKRYSHLRPRFENLFDSLALLPELQPDRVRIAPRTAVARGIDVLLSHNPAGGPWHWWLGYSLSSVEDRIDSGDVRRSWDQLHGLSGGVTRNGARWDLALGLLLHSGWPTTAVTPAADFATSGQVAVGARNGSGLDVFATVDVRATRRFELRRGELRAYAEVTNALDRSNDCCRRYQVTGSPADGFEFDGRTRHWAGLVPSVGVLWIFD